MALNLSIKEKFLLSLSQASYGLFGMNASFWKPLPVFFHKMASGGWWSKGHLWVTGEADSPMLVLRSLDSPAAGVPSCLCSLPLPNLLVDESGFLAFVHMLVWPASDHNSGIAFGLKVSTFNSLLSQPYDYLSAWLLVEVGREEVGTLRCPEHLAQDLGSQEYFLRLAR